MPELNLVVHVVSCSILKSILVSIVILVFGVCVLNIYSLPELEVRSVYSLKLLHTMNVTLLM